MKFNEEMDNHESDVRRAIQQLLYKEGHKKFGYLLGFFDLNLTNDPSVIAYTIPSTQLVVVNGNLSKTQISFVIRHELLHQIMKHEIRLAVHCADLLGLKIEKDKLNRMLKSWRGDKPFDKDVLQSDIDTLEKIKNEMFQDELFNYAMDYEESNRAYTYLDKKTAKAIKLYNVLDNQFTLLPGLVTEIDEPQWADWSMEDMYDALRERDRGKNPPEPPTGGGDGGYEGPQTPPGGDGPDGPDGPDGGSEGGQQGGSEGGQQGGSEGGQQGGSEGGQQGGSEGGGEGNGNTPLRKITPSNVSTGSAGSGEGGMDIPMVTVGSMNSNGTFTLNGGIILHG